MGGAVDAAKWNRQLVRDYLHSTTELQPADHRQSAASSAATSHGPAAKVGSHPSAVDVNAADSAKQEA